MTTRSINNFRKRGSVAAAETLSARAHAAVPTPEQDEEVLHAADILTILAERDRGEAATAMGTSTGGTAASVVAPVSAAALRRWVELTLTSTTAS